MKKLTFLVVFLFDFVNLENIKQTKSSRLLLTDSLYASSLYRNKAFLTNVNQIARFDGLDALNKCLMHCYQLKNICKSFNYAQHNGTCILLSESLCLYDTYELIEDEQFSYFDIMTTPEYEKKHLTDDYCRVYGKCSEQCYPRKPHLVEEQMTRDEAFKYCAKIQRKLAQPKSQMENQFYGEFGRKFLYEIKQNSNDSKILNIDKTSARASTLESQLKDIKFWIGVSDSEMEGFWLYDDGSAVSEHFSAWALSQPDNGGGSIGAKKENCVAIEMKDFNWFDVQCDQQFYFFCA